MTHNQDIESESDVKLLVDTFYKKILSDPEIGFFFTKVVKLDFIKHMPTMYDFWNSLLFLTAKYKGNPMIKHIELNGKSRLEKRHFDRWLALWNATVDDLFSGSTAKLAKDKAQQIAILMHHKVRRSEDPTSSRFNL